MVVQSINSSGHAEAPPGTGWEMDCREDKGEG